MVDINELRLQCFLLNGGPPSKFEPEVPELIVKADFLRYLESLSAGQLALEEKCSDWERLLLGVSALQLFLQCNVVGPIPVIGDDLHERISRVIARARPNVAEDDPSTSRAALNLDGESAYPLVNFPHLLLVAKDAFSSVAVPGIEWWRLRADWTHQLTLQEPVETLRVSIVDSLIPSILASPFYAKLTTPHRVLFHLEAYHAYHYYSRAKDAARCLDAAVSLAGVDLRVTGALGKRTKWQQEDKSQLVVGVGQGEGEINDGGDSDDLWFAEDASVSWWHADAPKDIALDDDTLLDKVKFKSADDNNSVMKNSWNALEQAVVYCVMMDVGRRSCVRELTEEELAAFRSALLEQEKKIFGVQLGCLFYRSRGEREKSRKVERALMQLEDLTNGLKRFGVDVEKKDYASSTSSTGHRVFLVYSLCLPFVWTVETLMADVMISLGLTAAALDVYLRLEAWTNVVDCYRKQGKRGAAEKLIREKIDLTKDPNMLCVLGDVTLDSMHYEEAWELSKGSCARAMRTLGYDHLYKHRPEQAVECFEKSIAVNALQIPVWYSLGCTSLMLDDNKRAEKAFLRCVHLDYDNYEAWTNLASAQVKLGYKEKASNTLQEALKCNYENWRIWENFLVVSADVGHPEDVIRAYHRLLDLKGEKYVDSEVLTVLVTLIIKLRETIEPEDEPNRLAFQRLEKKCRELFGRVTSSTTDNADIWKAYGGLYLHLRPFVSSAADNNNDNDSDRRLKGIQFLQRSLRCLTQKSGWELEVASVEETLKKSNEIVRLVFEEDDADGGAGGVTIALFSSLKMVVRTTVAKIDKKYGEAAPSENAKAEVALMKTYLTDIEGRINVKKEKER